MSAAPARDGHVHPEQWADAICIDGLTYEHGQLQPRRCFAYIGATEHSLHFAIVSELPPNDEPLITQVTKPSNRLAFDDSIEIWIDPAPDDAQGVTYQMLANAVGVATYQTHVWGGIPNTPYYGWKGDYAVANGLHDGFWHAQVTVPLEAVDPERDVTNGVWSFNLCRNWKQPWAFSCLGSRQYEPRPSLRFQFSRNEALAVHLTHRTDPFSRRVAAEMSLHNPGQDAVDTRAQFYLRRDRMPEVTVSKTVTVAPGSTKVVSLEDEDHVSEGFELFAVACGNNGAPPYFTRFARWRPLSEPRWNTTKQTKPPLDFQFAYYPTRGVLRIAPNITGLDEQAVIHSLTFSIRRIDDHEVIATARVSEQQLQDTNYRCELSLPPLNGEYEVVAEATGRDVPTLPIAKSFVRRVYEWEGNTFGKGRKVYKPFETVQVDGNRVGLVLRDYDMNGLGLLDQVWAWDVERISRKPILAAPMRYRAMVDGQDVLLEPSASRIHEAADDRAVIINEFCFEHHRFQATSTIEYDGMVRVDLQLPEEGIQALQSLDLEIPLSDDGCDLMHAMIDGIRYPILTDKVPRGWGVVWDATKLENVECPANFCTYIWLGDANRGLAWFAENDHGWAWDPATPNIELERQSDALVLRVHLVNQAFTPHQPRKITFGIQASPVKPRLGEWRHRYFTDRYQIIGTDIKWFALGCCGSVYPAHKDMRLWEAILQANECAFTDTQCDQILHQARPYFEPYGRRTMEQLEASAPISLRQSEGRKLIFYYDRSSSPCIEEFQTFVDEWGLGEFSDRRGVDARHEVKIVPTESYCDFAMWWYRKSFELAGNQGIYVDNNYFVACANPVMTDAYTRPDGTVVPSTGIWQLRELAKRQFVLMNELGLFPFTMAHMTTTLILPILSFYTAQYDWEHKFSEGDVHARHDQAYLLALSNGDQLGAWPIVLHEQQHLVGDLWTSRTWMGVCLVHELIIDPYVWDQYIPPANPVFETFRQPILELVQHDDVEVYRYWDERDQPVTANDADLPTIVFVRRGIEAIWVTTNNAPEPKSPQVHMDLKAMGFAGACRLVNIETGDQQVITGQPLSLELASHDLRAFRLLPISRETSAQRDQRMGTQQP